MNWDEYFMSVAFLTAMRSKDPSTQVGACIVNADDRIVGVGYNGFPSGIPDEALPWEKTSSDGYLETKYPYVCHAELNAVLNKNVESCKGCRLYSTLFPCCECAKVIIQSGIRCVIYASDKNREQDVFKASKRMFALAGVKMMCYMPAAPELCLPLRYPGDETDTQLAGTDHTATELPSTTPDAKKKLEFLSATPDAKKRRCFGGDEEDFKSSSQSNAKAEVGQLEHELSPIAHVQQQVCSGDAAVAQ